jgi:hypothetical protein
VDHDKLGHLTTLTSLENVTLPEMVAWVVDYVQEERSLEFDWHQVARKSWVADQGSGKYHGLGQRMDTVFVGTSSTDSRNWTLRVGWGFLPMLCSKDSGKGFPLSIRWA